MSRGIKISVSVHPIVGLYSKKGDGRYDRSYNIVAGLAETTNSKNVTAIFYNDLFGLVFLNSILQLLISSYKSKQVGLHQLIT